MIDEKKKHQFEIKIMVDRHKVERIGRMLYITFAVLTWGVVGMTLALSIYAASTQQKRIEESEKTVKELRGSSLQRPFAVSLPAQEEDTAFLDYYRLQCKDTDAYKPNLLMNAPGGFTSGKNCPLVSLSYEWALMSEIDKTRLCQSYRAYSANNHQEWGHCEYEEKTASCTFSDLSTASQDFDDTGCTDRDADGASDSLQGSTTYPHSTRYTAASSRVVVMNNDIWNPLAEQPK